MDFGFRLLGLLLLALPFIMFCTIYGLSKKFGSPTGPQTHVPPASKPRPTYFYPTRERDGNDA